MDSKKSKKKTGKKPIIKSKLDYVVGDVNELKKRVLFLELWYEELHPKPAPDKPSEPLSPEPEKLPETELPKGS